MPHHLQSLLRAHCSFRCPAAVVIAFPRTSLPYCHSPTPPNHRCSSQALETAAPSTSLLTHPEVASLGMMGLPTTIFLGSTPWLASSSTAVPGAAVERRKSSSQESQRALPWLQQATLQKLIPAPASWCTVRYPPLGQALPCQWRAMGLWTITLLGSSLRRRSWKATSQSSPVPRSKLRLSCQFTSTPSSWFSPTKTASRSAHSAPLKQPSLAGFSLGPKADTSSLTRPSAQRRWRLAWISCLVLPKTAEVKKSVGLFQMKATPVGASPHCQQVSAMWLQIFSSLKPGTPIAPANFSGGVQVQTLSTQPSRTGQAVCCIESALSASLQPSPAGSRASRASATCSIHSDRLSIKSATAQWARRSCCLHWPSSRCCAAITCFCWALIASDLRNCPRNRPTSIRCSLSSSRIVRMSDCEAESRSLHWLLDLSERQRELRAASASFLSRLISLSPFANPLLP